MKAKKKAKEKIKEFKDPNALEPEVKVTEPDEDAVDETPLPLGLYDCLIV
jgi:hypothetical protein